ncbi:DMT family transporter [Paenibacillus gansuensis]|uniref:DMT family transporter n=1 Tax=Paenibacillus gansuensis TaxID=306542 RepID=A0ABW5P7V1_9BACL
MSRKLYGALVLLSLIWGGSFFFIKMLLHHFDPLTIALLRSGTGLIVISGIMVALRQPLQVTRLPWVPMIAAGLLNTTLPWALIAFSETRVTSGMASVLNATTPIWTLVTGVVLFGNPFRRTQGVGLAIATVGLLILLRVNPVSIISVDPVGFFAMVTATLCYGLSAQLSKRYLTGLSMYQTTFGTLLCGVVGSGIAAFTLEDVSFAPLASPEVWGLLFGLGALGSGVAYVLFYFMIQRGSPEFATNVTYLVPVTAILWGASLLGEELHWSLLAGLAFILGGVYIANRKTMPAKAGYSRRIPAGRAKG